MELEFIPLKTPDGALCGHARVQNGFVSLFPRKRTAAQALVFTDGGYANGPVGTRIRAGGHVRAIALHENGMLACCGFARNCRLNADDLRLRLIALSGSLASAASVQTPAQTAERAEPPKLARADAPEPFAPAVPPRAESPGLERAAAAVEAAAEIRMAERPAAPPEPVKQPDPAPEKTLTAPPETWPLAAPERTDSTLESAANAESFAALLARAEAVFARISALHPQTPEMVDVPTSGEPPYFGPVEEAADALGAPEEETPRRSGPSGDWYAEVDALLAGGDFRFSGREPADAALPVANPFPHIFPGARFRLSDDGERLSGEWQRGMERFAITAVRGEYSPQPPSQLAGFTRFIRARSGNYWVRVDDA